MRCTNMAQAWRGLHHKSAVARGFFDVCRKTRDNERLILVQGCLFVDFCYSQVHMWTEGGEAVMSTLVHSVRDGQGGPLQAALAGGAGLRAFTRIAELWHLSIAEQLALLGITSRSTYFKWRKEAQPKLPRDTLERLSYLLGIYKALQLLLPDTHAADEWIRRSNDAPLFGGKSALERMLSGNVADLYTVRQYLDAQRG
jgi:hypothetical protein